MTRQPTLASPSSRTPLPHLSRIAHALRRLTPRLTSGRITIETPGGRRISLAGAAPGPTADLKIHRWRAVARALLAGDIGFSDAYAAGEVSTPDLAGLMRFAAANASSAPGSARLRIPAIWNRVAHALNRNSVMGSRRNISAHYDLGNDFYRLWLDAGMTYSCARFPASDVSLEAAQAAKLDGIVESLNLRGGEAILEIGCGWGGLAERLVREGCHVTGLTLSQEQLAFARARLAEPIEERRCDLRLQDYRDVSGTFDRIVSIEMMEAVGEAYWRIYFERVRQSLCDGGTAVIQTIVIDEGRYASYRRNPDFIQMRIFPGGMLPTAAIVAREAAACGLTLVRREMFGSSYARTLEIWRERFERSWPAIQKLGFDECFRRRWEYYLDYCRVGFQIGAVDVGLFVFKSKADSASQSR
jgi:cyclopropane-fatty-acyl-phospholipid synthase